MLGLEMGERSGLDFRRCHYSRGREQLSAPPVSPYAAVTSSRILGKNCFLEASDRWLSFGLTSLPTV